PDEAELRRVVEEWNRTAAPLPVTTLPELFAATVAAHPDAVAVVCGDVTLTYAELNARANRLAHVLIARGVTPGSAVGLLMERSAELVVALLAVVKAGAVYVPLDAAHPRERLRAMAAEAGVSIVLTDSGDSAGLEAIRLPVDGPDAGDPAVRTSGDDLAY